MNEQSYQGSDDPTGPGSDGTTGDAGNNAVGPTEKLREHDKPEGELSVPGAQNPESEEIKDEKGPNTE
jgi:hypothetical protein